MSTDIEGQHLPLSILSPLFEVEGGAFRFRT